MYRRHAAPPVRPLHGALTAAADHPISPTPNPSLHETTHLRSPAAPRRHALRLLGPPPHDGASRAGGGASRRTARQRAAAAAAALGGAARQPGPQGPARPAHGGGLRACRQRCGDRLAARRRLGLLPQPPRRGTQPLPDPLLPGAQPPAPGRQAGGPAALSRGRGGAAPGRRALLPGVALPADRRSALRRTRLCRSLSPFPRGAQPLHALGATAADGRGAARHDLVGPADARSRAGAPRLHAGT